MNLSIAFIQISIDEMSFPNFFFGEGGGGTVIS